MTPEQREAELIAAMHEGRAPVDMEYTPIAAPLPELVRPAEVAAMRARITELEAELAAVPVDAIGTVFAVAEFPFGYMNERNAVNAWLAQQPAVQP